MRHNPLQSSFREAFRPFARRFGFAALSMVVLFVAGALGYVAIEGWSFFDGLYMAVTVSTSLGIMEVHPLSQGGRVLTMIILVLGITGLGVYWGLITALVVEYDLGDVFRRRRMNRRIEKLNGHFIVAGAGRIGRVVAREMLESETPFVLVDIDVTKLTELREELGDLLFIHGDATKEHTLRELHVERAAGLAACLGEDADNLLLCLTARGLRRDLRIVSRAYDEESFDKLKRAGADDAISPNVSGGVRLASALLRPHVATYLDIATRAAGLSLRLEEAAVGATSHLAGKTLGEARIPQHTGLVVVAVRRPTQGGLDGLVHSPGPDTRLHAGDILIVVGEDARVRKLRQYVESGT